jgi:hypothetical protein
MTSVEILFRYAAPPTETVAQALARTREVYGICRLDIDRAAHTLRVEYDATRLDAATVAKLIRQAGLEIDGAVSPEPRKLAPMQAHVA